MDRPTCPVSGTPVDLMTHATDAHQVVSHKGRWMSRIFKEAYEAAVFMQTFDLRKAMFEAKEEHRGTVVRLVGKDWMTKYMTSQELIGFKAILGDAEEPKRRRASKTVKDDVPDAATE